MSRIEESTLRKFLATAAVAFALSAEVGASLTVAPGVVRDAAGEVAEVEQGGTDMRRISVLREIK